MLPSSMARPVDAPRVPREIEVVVVNVENVASHANAERELISSGVGLETPGSGSPEEPAASFRESSGGAVGQQWKELPIDENPRISSSSRAEEALPPGSDASSRRHSRLLVNRPKSRLLDPPEDQWQQLSRIAADSRPFSAKGGEDREEEEDDLEDIPEEYKETKLSVWTVFQFVSLVLIIAAVVCSLWINALKRQKLWDLPLWRWEVMVFALICGNLVSGWLIRLAVFLIERNFILRKRVLYFVYGLKKAVRYCIWFGLVLLVWNCVFDDKVEKETKSRILPRVTKILVCVFIGAVSWLLKTLLIKVLASSFHVNTFFERIQESLFNQYLIETLSGPPLFKKFYNEEEERAIAEFRVLHDAGANIPSDLRETLLPRSDKFKGNGRSPIIGKSPRLSREASLGQDGKILIEQLHRLNQKNVSAWKMKRLMNIIRNGNLSTLDEHIHCSDMEDKAALEIRSEHEAEKAAKRIFWNVAKRGSKCIYLDDVMRFMSKDEAYKAMHLFGAVSEREGISWQSLKNWVVNAFRERRALALSLNDTKTAVDKLHNLLNVIIAFIIMVIGLTILQVDVTHFLIVISSQLLVMAFIFGNTCKTIFEAIIYLFVIHPFDVGDRCELDGVQMVVEEINILTTVFLRYDNQKIVYPNSVLATKPISNYYRSPDMGDGVDFSIHISTPAEIVAIMKELIVSYIESRSDHWHPAPMVVTREIEDLNRVLMSVWLTHRMNHQDMGEKFVRRALLVEEMIKIFKELDIEYRLLPLDVNIQSLPEPNSTRLPSNWTAAGS
ncbi:mechanosensitive ion channel protein 6-like [Rhodamnia argentea]|uniref:Mechanosensitive ion channel protein n=1 Tax=Rhodamnia argentea TaxID=178133 RepID=A0A8B8NSJ0_9MYRT|nr:mechanosensitive ion channel protein 6-like [Rhodamnia argentea]